MKHQDNTLMQATLDSWHLIHDGSLDSKHLNGLNIILCVSIFDMATTILPEEGARVFFYLDDEKLKQILPIALVKNWEVAPLPHPKNRWTTIRYGVDRDLKSAIAHALITEPTAISLLTCNDIPVLSSVVAGQALTLDAQNAPNSRWAVFKSMIQGMTKLRPLRFSLITGKEHKITTAAIGVIALTGPGHPFLGQTLRSLVTLDNSRSTLLVLAPRSAMEYLQLLIRIIFLRSLQTKNLPASVGLFRSRKIVVETGKNIELTVDGMLFSAKNMELELSEAQLRVRLGRHFPSKKEFTTVDKDVIKGAQLPSGESVNILSNSSLPFFNRASEDEFRELFLALKDAAILSRPFLSLMILSVLLANFGLYANSAPVIIGAMILAPLMGPIISFSMGLARGNAELIQNSLKTLMFGIGTALITTMIVSSIMPLRILTAEMVSRLSPNLLDLGVAVVSGIAGAYANAKEDVAKSLAGVAIAVALVPPLCVAGIGMGWMDWNVVRGAFLLFVTNLVGITVAGSLTFLALGFAPFRMAKTGVGFSLALLATVTIPLYFAFDELIQKNRIVGVLTSAPLTSINGHDVHIEPVSVQLGQTTLVRLQAISSEPLDGDDLTIIKEMLTNRLKRPVIVEMSVLLRQ